MVGLEPMTSCMSSMRSNQLSYTPATACILYHFPSPLVNQIRGRFRFFCPFGEFCRRRPRRGGGVPPRTPPAKATKEAETANEPRKGGARGTVLLQRREDQIEHDAADEDDRHAHGRDVADHDAEIDAHPLLLQADLVRDEVLIDEVSGEDAGADRHDGHEDAVGEVVEHIQDAVGSAGRELEMDAVEHAEAERGEHAEHEDEPEHDEAGEPALEVQVLAQDGDDRFHQRDGRGERREKDEDEERRADPAADAAEVVDRMRRQRRTG